MEKKRSSFKIINSLISLLGNLKYLIKLAVFGGVLGNLCAISVMTFGAIGVCKLIDENSIQMPLWLIILLTIGSGVLRGLLRFFEQYNNHYIAFTLLAELRNKIFHALARLAPSKLEDKQKGSLISMLTADIETLEVFYAHTISPVLIAFYTNGIIVVLVSIISNIYLGLIALASYLIIGIAVPFISFKFLKKEGKEYRNDFAVSSSYFLDSIKGINELTIHNAYQERKDFINRESHKMNKRTISIKRKSSIVDSVTLFMVSFVILLTTLVGVLFVIHNMLSLTSLIIALVLIFSSFGPVLALANLPSNLTQTFASGDRILDLLEEKPAVMENDGDITFDFQNVKLENVSFSYGDHLILDNVNLEINTNEIIGIVGESGSGKSTILKLLDRFYDVNSGSILYNNINIKDINTNSLRNNVVLVSQSTYLFDDTILNNIKFVKEDATLDEIKEACRLASIDDFISSLPNGYDTEVGLLGDSLSAGEKQRIGLARAFLSGAKLILLDEVTSNVDAINEGIILRSIKNIKDKAFVIVSHRESTVSIANRVYHMNNGKV